MKYIKYCFWFICLFVCAVISSGVESNEGKLGWIGCCFLILIIISKNIFLDAQKKVIQQATDFLEMKNKKLEKNIEITKEDIKNIREKFLEF